MAENVRTTNFIRHNTFINQFQKVNPPHKTINLICLISNSKQQVDDFWGELTF